MHYLIIDRRFPAPVHVFLEQHPLEDPAFPGLPVKSVELDSSGSSGGLGSVANDPWQTSHFREFATDRAAAAAGFTIVEPRYVGPTWAAYDRAFGFGVRKLKR